MAHAAAAQPMAAGGRPFCSAAGTSSIFIGSVLEAVGRPKHTTRHVARPRPLPIRSVARHPSVRCCNADRNGSMDPLFVLILGLCILGLFAVH